jgi:UDP-GlcNAc:undecaprenyl-phosphate GlcNAc-1-phosphate transferase
MSVNLAACVTSFLVSFIFLPVIIKYSLEKNLVDAPNRRKIHTKVTPSLGGIAIFVGFLIASLIWMDFGQWHEIRYVLASLIIVFLLGVRDDLVPFRALHKLYGQIVAVIILLFSSIQISSLYGLFGVHEVPSFLGYIVTGFTIIIITNSFNLIDGLDGLAGSVGIVALTAFGIWFFWVGDTIFSLFSFAMMGGILAFLVFNWEPSEIFMGDTGAMVIGMLLAILVIHFMSVNYHLPETHPAKFTAIIASAVSFIIIPLCDTLRIIILRISKGQSPFKPDKSHIHHRLMRLGITHSRTSLILASLNGIYIAGAFLFRQVGDRIMLPVVLIYSIALSVLLDIFIRRRKTLAK